MYMHPLSEPDRQDRDQHLRRQAQRTWPLLYSFRTEPDGFVRLGEGRLGVHLFRDPTLLNYVRRWNEKGVQQHWPC